MSVIAKLSMRDTQAFGMGNLSYLGCVCANDMMASQAETEENRLFTKYSPNGEMKVNHPAGGLVGLLRKDACVYAMMLGPDEVDDPQAKVLEGERIFPGAIAVCKARIVSVTWYSETSAKVEICSSYDASKTSAALGIDNFNWWMSVDNPPAVAQFKPGTDGYWLAIYPEANFNRDQAIRAAHGHPEPEQAAAAE